MLPTSKHTPATPMTVQKQRRRSLLLAVMAGVGVTLFCNAWLLALEQHGATNDTMTDQLEGFRLKNAPSSSESEDEETSNAVAGGKRFEKDYLVAEPIHDADYFSACMLIKDDNELLDEWIAYHYFAVKMRYLVVAVDPASETSPQPIFDKWRKHTDITIETWEDINFMPPSFIKKGYYIPPEMFSGDAKKSKWHEGHEDPEQVIADKMKISNHRFRQITFLSTCLRHLRKTKRVWAYHIDTDEYIVVNPYLKARAARYNLTIPSIEEPNSVLSVFQQVIHHPRIQDKSNAIRGCISMPRLLYGSEENEEFDSISKDVPPAFNASLFESIRWAYHSAPDDEERNAQPKVIVNVASVDAEDEMLSFKAFSIHRPSKALCRRIDQLVFQGVERFPLTVNHYLGTWTRYVGRNDTRRSNRVYEFKAHVKEGKDTSIHNWMSGFVKSMGLDKARLLLDTKLADYSVTAK
jgi:hypothetical protein